MLANDEFDTDPLRYSDQMLMPRGNSVAPLTKESPSADIQ